MHELYLVKKDTASAAQSVLNAYDAAMQNPMNVAKVAADYENWWMNEAQMSLSEAVLSQKVWLAKFPYLQACDYYSHYLFSGEFAPHIPQDVDKAISIQEKSGFYHNQLAAGIMHYYKKEYEKAYELISVYYGTDNGVAAGYLGLMYAHGLGCSKKGDKAYACLRVASKQLITPFVAYLGDFCLTNDFKQGTRTVYSPNDATSMYDYIERALGYYELAVDDEFNKIRYEVAKSIVDAKKKPGYLSEYNFHRDGPQQRWGSFTNHTSETTSSYEGEVFHNGARYTDMQSKGWGIWFVKSSGFWSGFKSFTLAYFDKGKAKDLMIFKNNDYFYVGNTATGRNMTLYNDGRCYIGDEYYFSGFITPSQQTEHLRRVLLW